MKFKPEMLKLLDSSIPFLGASGQKIIRSTQYLAELFQSPAGVKAYEAINNLEPSQDLEVTGQGTGSSSNPFTLFLVFYLLILSVDHKYLGQTTPIATGTTDNPSELIPLPVGDGELDQENAITENP